MNFLEFNTYSFLSLTCIANSSSFPIFMCRFWSCHYFVWLAVVWCDTFAFYWRFICNTHGLGVAKEVSSYKTMWAFFQVMDFIFVFHSSSTNRLYCTIHISYSGWSSHSISWISLIRVILLHFSRFKYAKRKKNQVKWEKSRDKEGSDPSKNAKVFLNFQMGVGLALSIESDRAFMILHTK